MTSEHQDRLGFYNNIEVAAAHIIEVVSGLLQVNTIFAATNDGLTNTILKAFNRQESDRQRETDLLFTLTLSKYAEAAEAAAVEKHK